MHALGEEVISVWTPLLSPSTISIVFNWGEVIWFIELSLKFRPLTGRLCYGHRIGSLNLCRCLHLIFVIYYSFDTAMLT